MSKKNKTSSKTHLKTLTIVRRIAKLHTGVSGFPLFLQRGRKAPITHRHTTRTGRQQTCGHLTEAVSSAEGEAQKHTPHTMPRFDLAWPRKRAQEKDVRQGDRNDHARSLQRTPTTTRQRHTHTLCEEREWRKLGCKEKRNTNLKRRFEHSIHDTGWDGKKHQLQLNVPMDFQTIHTYEETSWSEHEVLAGVDHTGGLGPREDANSGTGP